MLPISDTKTQQQDNGMVDMAEAAKPQEIRPRRLPFTFVDGRGSGRSEEVWREGIDMPLLLSKLRARRFLLMRGAWVGALAGLLAACGWMALRTPVWSAATEVLVSNTTLQLSGQDAVVTQLMVENTLLQSQMLLARSQAVIERAMVRIGPEKLAALLPQRASNTLFMAWLLTPAPITAETKAQERQAMMLSLRDRVAVNRSGASQIITISVRAPDADSAVLLATEVTQAFVEESRAINAVVTTSGAFRERIQVLGPTVRLISGAIRPTGKNGPRALMVLSAVPLAGALLGVTIAVLAAAASRRIWSGEQIVKQTGREFFGYLPASSSSEASCKSVSSPRTLSGQPSSLAVALRRVRAAALERRQARPRVVGITHMPAGKGHSSVAKGLALLLSGSGQRILLVDGAISSHELTHSLALDGTRGLQDVLHEPGLLPSVICTSLRPDIDLLSAGSERGDVDVLWPALPRALSALPGRPYDWVIIDLQALEPPSAIRAAGIVIDDIILIVQRGTITQQALELALEGLGATRQKLLGMMMSTAPQDSFTALARCRGWVNRLRHNAMAAPSARTGALDAAALAKVHKANPTS